MEKVKTKIKSCYEVVLEFVPLLPADFSEDSEKSFDYKVLVRHRNGVSTLHDNPEEAIKSVLKLIKA